ncbi:MAG TPA: hypothetical protein VGH54_10660 [Mycobacterium sp.]|jgi:hypothetical protein|uniref:phage major capsid protein n=1 Tax=Mycobacterium sp. TaxID=1785 RepID=UPI002F40010A
MSRRRTGRLTEGAVVSVKAKDFVSWSASSGVAKGRVKSVHKGKVPAVPVKVEGNDVEPAARVEMYAKDGDGWKPTGHYLGLSSAELTKIDELPAPQATTEAVTAGSFDEIRRIVQAAIEDKLEQQADAIGNKLDNDVYIYVQDIGPDWAVYCSGMSNDQFKVTYSMDAAGAVTLGTPIEVQATTTYEPLAADEPVTESRKEADSITGHLIEAKGEDAAGGRIFGVRIIANGDSKNMRRYPADVLTEAVSLYEGAKAYDHHRTEAELKTSTILGLVGSYRDVEAKEDGIYGDLHLLPSATHTAEALDASLAAQEAGLAGLVGISHDVMANYRTIVDGGRRLSEATKILSVNSADVVADPAAGGRATRMVAGGLDTAQKENEMPATVEELLELLKTATPEQRAAVGLASEAPAAEGTKESVKVVDDKDAPKYESKSLVGKMAIREAVSGAGFAETATTRVVETVTGLLAENFTEGELLAQVETVKGLLAGFEKQGLTPTIQSVEVAKESMDKKIEALNASFDGDFSKGYRSLKEAFVDITGYRPRILDSEDFNRKVLSESVGGGEGFDSSLRSTESVVSGTWNTILGDSVTRRMVAEYNQPTLATWRNIISSMVPVNDFRTQRIERLGGYGVLPGVNQGAPYQPLATPGNEEATYGITKRGGTEDLTIETIANDDLRAVTRIPVKLGLAAAQTLFRFVWDMLQSNAVCSFDSTALFAAGHNNLDAGNTLSQTNLSLGRKKMRKQSAFGDSTDLLSIVPKFLIVPSDLEELAFQLCTSAVAIPATPAGPTNTPNIHQGLTPIVVDYFSALAPGTWFLAGDPAMVPTIELGFYQGKQDPDLLVQSDVTVGSVFTSDKITYKIRHIYSGTPLDFRGFYRGN